MYLNIESRTKLYKLLFSLFEYTNKEYKINPKIGCLTKAKGVDPGGLIGIREKLWGDNKIIDEYIIKNPDNFEKEELEIIEGWKNKKNGTFTLYKYLKDEAIFMDDNNIYKVVGISNEISDMFHPTHLPLYVKTVLLPFEGKMVYDTIIIPYNIRLGGGIRKIVNELYKLLKDKDKENYIDTTKKKLKEENKQNKYYEIKVSLRNTKPIVWRRLRIPAKINFHELNAIIQLAFNWCGYHLYSFEVGATLHEEGTIIELPSDYDYDFPIFKEKENAKKVKIAKYFDDIKRLKYVYDFGDNWIHDILIEKIEYSSEELKYPICIKAKMASLPEDCGGPWGYEDLLKDLEDENSEEHEEKKEWVENGFSNYDYDRTNIDIDEINERLVDYKEHAKFLLGK